MNTAREIASPSPTSINIRGNVRRRSGVCEHVPGAVSFFLSSDRIDGSVRMARKTVEIVQVVLGTRALILLHWLRYWMLGAFGVGNNPSGFVRVGRRRHATL